MPQNIQPEVFIKMVLSNWELQNTRMNNLLENLTDEQLASETAPGRNTGMYLLEYEMKEESLIISGTLSLSELFYEKIIAYLFRTKHRVRFYECAKCGACFPVAEDLKEERNVSLSKFLFPKN